MEPEIKEQKCVSCEGIGDPLNIEETKGYLSKVLQWQLSKNGKWISRNFVKKNFKDAVNLINEITNLAESEGHHPDLHLTNYRNLKIDLSTHAIGGLSINDFILAAKINELPLARSS